MNKVMLIGYVGVEPEIRYFEQDEALAQVRLATTERGYTLPNGTQVPDRTDWHSIIFYKSLAKYVERYVHKGDRLYVEGRLRYRSYDDKRGIKRTVAEILAENLEFLSQGRATRSAEEKQQESQKPADSTGSGLPF